MYYYNNGIPKNRKFVKRWIKKKPSKFKKRNWIEINDEARGTYSPNKQKLNLKHQC